ncbi:type II secretion system F family protein [Bradymonas sediminis]|nr:type II secretion system F family protein [Bradymonas sediminis]
MDHDKSDAVVREGSTYLSDPEAEQLCQTFADGLESGIGYSRILDILSRQSFNRKTIDRLREALLERGDVLAAAFARYGVLDPSARKLILVADEQGVLPETFSQLSVIYGKRYKRKREFVMAMVEPLILVALGVIVFGNLMGEGFVEMALSANVVEQITDIAIKSLIQSAILALVCGFLSYVWLNLPVDFAPRDLFARIWLRMPVVSEPGRLSALSLFCRYLQQSIAGGMTVYQGLELASEASNHPGILKSAPAAQRMIEDGHTLAEALYVIRALPAEVLENIDIGEASGRLDERLEYLADRFEQKSVEAFKTRMQAYSSLTRYAVIILVVVMVFMAVLKLDIGV